MSTKTQKMVVVVFGLAAFVLIMLIGGAAVYALGSGLSSKSKVEGVQVAYVRDEAKLRACPRRTCQVLQTLRHNQQVAVIATVNGEEVDGSRTWTAVRFGTGEAFVHESLIQPDSSTDEQSLLWALFSVLSIGAVALTTFSLRVKGIAVKLVEWSRGIQTLLPAVVLLIGIAVGALGYFYSRLEGGAVSTFLADTFVNLGAGFIGSAVTFLLFNSLLAGLVVDRPTLEKMNDDQRAELRDDLASLRSAVERLTMRLDSALTASEADRQRSPLERAWSRWRLGSHRRD
ncbi:hypothetical protein [Cryptosporangium phraense]|uniref:SH3 domain-containing protein n=1 Tax=Cryptosporangium phraense TaxID=2593070 RepID=A0A545AQ81_9ACTN|nr:hypothetical protein [Cryptosporangium phraense]TQS43430.1 hypothetical protein FL583_19560 [Cryptosporangium phraense]